MMDCRLLSKAKLVLETAEYQYFSSFELSYVSAVTKSVYIVTIRMAFLDLES